MNEVFKIIKDEGLDPALIDCEVSKLTYINSEYFYTFDMYVNYFGAGYEDKHYAIYSPGYQSKVEDQHPESWDRHEIYIKGLIFRVLTIKINYNE